jgi:very-short-patch-repair endonuclease
LRPGISTIPDRGWKLIPQELVQRLELQFLKLFKQCGFDPQRQVKVPFGSLLPIADFAVPDARLAIYVDGPHSVDANLRRDRRIREKLCREQQYASLLRRPATIL